MKVVGAPRAKLRTAMGLWRRFQPGASVRGGRITYGDFSFLSERTLADGVKVDWSVTAWKVADKHCRLQVRMGLYDGRVDVLRSIAMGFDMSRVAFLDFDVPAASSVMDGQDRPDPPVFDSDVQAEEFARIVEGYSRRIDRIWDFVRGRQRPGPREPGDLGDAQSRSGRHDVEYHGRHLRRFRLRREATGV